MKKERRPISIRKLAINNLKQKPLRTIGTIIIVAISAFVIFAGTIISISMKNGLQNMNERLGADLMVVPVGYDQGVEGILVKGEPAYFYLDKDIEEEISKVDGVKQVSAQFFLTSLNQECCDIPVQFIGFDPETDFSIQPWIAENYSQSLKDGELIVGHDIAPDGNRQLKFFGKEYTVAAKLDETGTGLDQAVYANMRTLMDLFAGAKESGLSFIDDIDPYSSVSTILIKIEDGYSAEEVTHNIRSSVDGIQVIQTKNMITGLADNLNGIIGYLYVLIGIFLMVALITLIIVFSVIANERKKEFAILCILGATGKKLSYLVEYEAFLICSLGGLIGTTLATLILILFQVLIGNEINLPYMLPNIKVFIVMIAFTLAVSLLLGPIATARTAIRLSKREAYLTLREGE